MQKLKFDKFKEECTANNVYDAEFFLAEEFRGAKLPTMDDISRRLSEIMNTDWYFKRYRHVREIRLHDGRGTQRCLGGRDRDGNYTITMPRWGRVELFLLHELAHCVGGPGHGHGPLFCSVYLGLVRRFIGIESANELRENFYFSDVRFRRPKRDRSWQWDFLFPEFAFDVQ
jgi:putative metallohydrolase (TIGR04338 family)